MQIKNVLNNISLYKNENITITEETVFLSDRCFNGSNPFGNISVVAGKPISVGGVSKSFQSKLANMGDQAMGSNAVNLYESLLYMIHESK